MNRATARLKVLNTGTNVLLVWAVGFLNIYLPSFSVLAIERLGGREAGTEALAYQELHQLVGQQGRLKHVECLQAGWWGPTVSGSSPR